VTEICENAFSNSALEQITFPDSLLRIGKEAFAETKLKNVTIPAGVEFIDQYAFRSCESLERVMVSKNTKYGSTVFPNSAKVVKY
jgi:hypothetical protein